MLGFLFALISAIGYSLNQIFNKKLLLNNLSSIETLLLSNFFILFFSFFLFLFYGVFDLVNYSFFDLILLIISGFFGFFGIVYLIKSFSILSVGEALSMANIYPFFVLFFSFFFMGIYINLINLLLMITVFFGIMILIKGKKSFKVSLKLFYPLITAFSWGLYGFVIYLLLNKHFNLYSIIFYLEFLILIFTLIYYLFIYKGHLKNFNSNLFSKNNLIYASLVAITTNIGTLFYGYSTHYINPAIASSIGSSQVVFAFIFSFFLLKERVTFIQILGISWVFLGLFLFNFF